MAAIDPGPADSAGRSPDTVRWLFGDQLGPAFLDHPDQRAVLVESRRVFARRRFHRQKAHLVLSAMRHRAAELGDRCDYRQAGTYAEGLAAAGLDPRDLSACHPTSYGARDLVDRLGVERLPARGYATSMADFQLWAQGRGARRLLLEDFYRGARERLGLLMDGEEPAGGRWNFDAENREPPPPAQTDRGRHQGELLEPEADSPSQQDRMSRLGVPAPVWPVEDEIDEQVRADLDRWEADGDVSFVGVDGPRLFPATRAEALERLEHFVRHRLDRFGVYEDAMLAEDPWMAHSLISSSLNLGLLDPVEVVRRVEAAYRAGEAPLAATEGFVRQVVGWRDYIWHLYWHMGPDYRHANVLGAREDVPAWFMNLDADAVEARCLSTVLAQLRDHGWVHHIPRLMILGNYALQRGWNPEQVTDFFHRSFVDGYDWVMVANVVGMSQYADGGAIVTKPYASAGAYINRMSDFCGGCRYNPKVRVGEDGCPYSAGYWRFLHRHRERLSANFRTRQPLRGLDRLRDLEALIEQEDARGSDPP